jgi:hypothetical protein
MSIATLSGSAKSSRVNEMLLSQVRSYADKLLDKPIRSQSRKVEGRTLRIRKDRLKKIRFAVRLRRLEKVLAVGNWLYETIRLVERNWRREVIEGKALYDASEEASILDFFREWTAPCERCLKEISYVRSKRPRIEGADRFKSHCEEAKRVLAGNSPFFDDKSNAARWAGVTAFLRPEPRPVSVDERGHVFETTGERFAFPGLDPERMLLALKEIKSDERLSRSGNAMTRSRDGLRDRLPPCGSE